MADFRAVETQLASKRRRRDDLRYSLDFGAHGIDAERREQVQSEISRLDEEIAALEAVYSRGRRDPLESVHERLDILTRIVEGDQATGHVGLRDVVRSLDQLVGMMDKRVSQLFLAFLAMIGLSLASILGQIVLLLRFAG